MAKVPLETVDEIWKMCDKDADSQLSIREFKVGFKKWLVENGKGNPSDGDRMFTQMFCGFDRDSDNQISKKEFYDQLINLQDRKCFQIGSEFRLEVSVLGKPKDRKSGLKKTFQEMDKDGGGLSAAEFRAFAERTGVVPPSEIDAFVKDNFRLADKDQSGNISFEEFAKYMDIGLDD